MNNVLAIVIALFAVCSGNALAADPYPVKPVRIIVASGPGSGDDFATRVVAERLSALLGQPFVVENRPGAGGDRKSTRLNSSHSLSSRMPSSA